MTKLSSDRLAGSGRISTFVLQFLWYQREWTRRADNVNSIAKNTRGKKAQVMWFRILPPHRFVKQTDKKCQIEVFSATRFPCGSSRASKAPAEY